MKIRLEIKLRVLISECTFSKRNSNTAKTADQHTLRSSNSSWRFLISNSKRNHR